MVLDTFYLSRSQWRQVLLTLCHNYIFDVFCIAALNSAIVETRYYVHCIMMMTVIIAGAQQYS
jgi:hypothetical protein